MYLGTAGISGRAQVQVCRCHGRQCGRLGRQKEGGKERARVACGEPASQGSANEKRQDEMSEIRQVGRFSMMIDVVARTTVLATSIIQEETNNNPWAGEISYAEDEDERGSKEQRSMSVKQY